MTDHPRTPDSGADEAHWEALARFLAGESSPEEGVRMRAWIAEPPERSSMVMGLSALSGMTDFAAAAAIDTEGALAKVHARMRRDAVTPLPLRPVSAPVTSSVAATARTVRAESRWRRWVPQLAAATLLVAAGTAWFVTDRGVSTAGSAQREFASAVGGTRTVDLPDGSRVVLGPSSRLVMGAGFAEGKRAVTLEGVGLFTVTHDERHPFTVETQGTRIIDVGTEFSVRSDNGYGVHVAVREGAVEVRRSEHGAPALLQKGDRAVIGTNDLATIQRGAVSDDDFDFARGALVFRDATIARVVADVRRWYGVEIVPGTQAMAGRHVTASFSTESREEALNVIALALGAVVEMRGDSALLRPRILRPPR
jgi:transmembrane sensor